MRRAVMWALRQRPGGDLVAAADRLRDQRDWPAAAAAYRQAVAAHPRAAGLHVQLGHALKESGDDAAAEDAYRTALGLAPQDADIPLQLGHLFNRRGDVAAAATWYAAAAALAPQDAEIAHHLAITRARLDRAPSQRLVEQGLAEMQSRQFDAAARLFREAVDRHGRRDICALLGHALKEQGDYAAAHAAYLDYRAYAAAEDPSLLADVELQMAHLFKIQMRFRDALEHYVAAKKLLPDVAHSENLLSEIRSEIKFCMEIIFPALRME